MSRRAAAAMLISQGEQARFIAGSVVAATGTPETATVSFSGMAAGDLAVIFAKGITSTPSTPSGWTAISLAATGGGANHPVIFWKLLSSGDISTGSVTISASGSNDMQGALICAYRYATSVTLKSSTESATNATSITLPAFSLSPASAGVLFFVEDDLVCGGAFLPPAVGIVTREGPTQCRFFYLAAYDFTTPSDYPEASLTWSNFATGGQQDGYVLELL